MWADARDFDLPHVDVAKVAAPGDHAALMAAVEQRIARRLDRSRPLWEMCFFTGLADRRVGLLIRMHHAIADGIAGVVTLGAFFGPAPGIMTEPTPRWAPAPPPPDRALIADNMRRRAAAAQAACGSRAHPRSTARAVRNAAAELRTLFHAPATPRTSLDRPVEPGRRVATIRGDLDSAQQIAHRHGATVNDVLLAITAAGLRALLDSRGELTAGLELPAYVPVTLHPADIPGPRDPVYLAAAQLREVFPLLPLIGNVTIGVGALSYAGQFNITVVTDRDAVSDADVFVTAADSELRGFFGAGAARRPGV